MKMWKKINNPISLIELLIGISILLISGIAYVTPENQTFYVSFIGIYIVLITLLIFGVLLFKPEVLYAPRDFKDEKNFIETMKLNKELRTKRTKITESRERE